MFNYLYSILGWNESSPKNSGSLSEENLIRVKNNLKKTKSIKKTFYTPTREELLLCIHNMNCKKKFIPTEKELLEQKKKIYRNRITKNIFIYNDLKNIRLYLKKNSSIL